MGMAWFLGSLAFLLLCIGAPEGRSSSRNHHALLALLVIGCFLAWALDRGFIS